MGAEPDAIRSLVVTADGVVSSIPCRFYGVTVDVAGTVTLYDNASAASGTKIWQGGGPVALDLGAKSVICRNGIFADITGNVATVFFD